MMNALQFHRLCDHVSRESGYGGFVRPHLFVKVVGALVNAFVSNECCVDLIEIADLQGREFVGSRRQAIVSVRWALLPLPLSRQGRRARM
jgi:uncharacterized membrane protein